MKDQPGVIGMYPVIEKGMEEPFVYESQCPTHVLGTIMKGHFTFKFIEGPQKDEEFDVQVGEFELRLPEGQELIKTPESYIELKSND